MHAFTTVHSERERAEKAKDAIRAKQARVETVEKFSGLRIRNRLVASMVLEDIFSDLRFFRLGDLRHDVDTRWATMGVLLEKQTRAGSNGNTYSVWKLGDLGPNDVTVTAFLFGQAHLDNHREMEGTIWAIVDGKLRADEKSSQSVVLRGGLGKPKPAFTVAVDEPRSLMKLGTSPDYARCKGVRRDGKPCTMHVNASTCEYCVFHATAALKSLSTQRMALGPGRAPKFTRGGKMVMGKKGVGGAPNAPPSARAWREGGGGGGGGGGGAAKREPPERTYTDLDRQKMYLKQSAKSVRGAALMGGMPVRGANGGDWSATAASEAMSAQRRARANDAFAAAGRGGSLSLGGRHGGGVGATTSRAEVLRNKEAAAAGGAAAAGAAGAAGERFVMMEEEDDCGVTDDDALAQIRAVMGSIRDPNDTRKPLEKMCVNVGGVAAAKPTPNLPGLLRPGEARIPLGKRAVPAVEENAAAAPDANKHHQQQRKKPQPAPGSFGDVFGAVAAPGMDAKSKYEDAAKAEDASRLDDALSALEKQDALHARITSTISMRVSASKCACGHLFDRRPKQSCVDAGHRATRVDAEKRWFKCANARCFGRAETLNKPYPNHRCAKCGSEDWDRTHMSSSALKSGAKKEDGTSNIASRDKMLARGVEHGFALGGLGGGGGGDARDEWVNDQNEVVG